MSAAAINRQVSCQSCGKPFISLETDEEILSIAREKGLAGFEGSFTHCPRCRSQFLARQQGLASLFSARDILDTFMATIWVGRRAWAAKKADLLVRFIRAYSRPIDWLSDPSRQKEV
jgi:hypothetical protein